jgi:hypothetical protein
MSAPGIVIELPELSGVTRVPSIELERLLAVYAAAGRRVDAGLAVLAGEVERRSTREHGHLGLAQSSGDRTADAFVSRVTGESGADARRLVEVGKLLEAPPVWFAEVADRVDAGDLSVGAAAAITTGLGDPSGSVSPDALLDATHTLLDTVGTLPPDKIARRARELRDELDADGVASREEALRARRFLRLTPQSDGMTRLFGMLDPESAALVTDAIDCVTAPRRNGPRFVDTAERARAEAIENDPRTTEQIALDALVDMVRIAGAADTGKVFGVRRPAVRVHVDGRDLVAGTGAATVEGQTASVSVATAERHLCNGYVPVVYQPGGSLDLGLKKRLFTERQRVALAAIWGGCAVETCERPPSWTEAHHALPWSQDGPTDVDNGVLLCRHHHMLLHNGGWVIHRPPGRGPDGWSMTDGRRRLTLVAKNRIRQRTLARTE